jgi:hypothetical protein
MELSNPPWRPSNEFIAVFVKKIVDYFLLSIIKSFWIRIRDPDSPKILDLKPDLMKWIRITV